MVCASVELAVGQGLVVVVDCGGVGGARGLGGEQFWHGGLRYWRGGVVPSVHDLVAFDRIDDLDLIDPPLRINRDSMHKRR
ncbi:hypothetical protein A5736_13425 [Mycobacterium sp. SP-6446]|nr:hypothetical protein A5736_13425 [Mycobacterium sp. SP-6446]